MKTNKTKIALSTIVFSSVFAIAGIVAAAANSSLYVSPTNITKTVGSTFSTSVGVTPAGNKVCAVEGTLVFNNLSCQSITVADGAMGQTVPSCANPKFLIGIPNCTTSDKVLMTVSVKAGSAGKSSLGATGVDVIGEGMSVGSTIVSGNYTVNAVVVPVVEKAVFTPTPKPVVKAKTEVVPTSTQSVGEAVVTPVQEVSVVATAQNQTGNNSLLASVGSIITLNTGNVLVGIVTVLVALLVIGYVLFRIKMKNYRKL
jgi:hypothetical protein